MSRIAAVVALVALAGPRTARADEPVLAMRAIAVNMTGVGSGQMGRLDLVVERWSTDAERARLRGILIEKGSDKLLDALRDMKPRVGYIRTDTSLGWDVGFAARRPFPTEAVASSSPPTGPMASSSGATSRDPPTTSSCSWRCGSTPRARGRASCGRGQDRLQPGDEHPGDRELRHEPVRLTQVDVLPPKHKK